MGLFTNPVVLNNGVARSFEFLGQGNENSALVGIYLETAAALAENSRIFSRYDKNIKSLRRGNLKIVKNYLTSASVYEPVTMNISFIGHPLHAQTDIENHLKLGAAAMAATDFYAKFVKGVI